MGASQAAFSVGVFDSLSLFASCVFIYSVLVASDASTSLIDAHSASILRTSHDVASIPSISSSQYFFDLVSIFFASLLLFSLYIICFVLIIVLCSSVIDPFTLLSLISSCFNL